MTAIFGTPLAAVLLAVEMLLFELRPRSLLPVALACTVAGFLRPWLFDAAPLFALQTAAAASSAFLSSLIAGLLSGILAALLTLALYKTEDLFEKLKLHWMWWPALGGLVVGIGGYIEPRALGIGYDVIGDLLNNRVALGIVLSLIVVKAVIWVVALGSGTSGGVLAPLLMLGAALGILLAPVLPGGSASLWALVCMASVLGATLGAPLTAVVFALELTHDSTALLPVLLATMTAYGFNALTMRRSIMTEKIARRGRHIYREYGLDPLERMHVGDLISPWDGHAVPSEMAAMIAQGRMVLASDTARRAAGCMAVHGVTRLPVVANRDSMRFVGVLDVVSLLEPNRATHHEETLRERLR
jgi:H+/Cl- antiporter ClcA